MKELVLAGSYAQFRDYCRLNNLDYRKLKYLSDIQDIRGIGNTTLHMAEGYWNRKDFIRDESYLYEYCFARNIRIDWTSVSPLLPVKRVKNSPF